MVLTLIEAAKQLRCSKAHLSNILNGKVPDVPPLPVFHLGRRVLIRQDALAAWMAQLEARESEAMYASGLFASQRGGVR